MKIAILSRNANLYSTKRLVEAAENAGHTAEVFDYLRCYLNITADKPTVHYKGKVLGAFDAVIPRISSKRTFYGTAMLRQFETLNTYTLNSSIAITRSRDKLRSLQLLSRAGVDLPKTGFANNINDTDDLIKTVGGAPLIIKLIEGTQGVGVVLAENITSAQSVIQAFRGINANIIVQEYIEEAKGSDIRCFVIGDRVVAAMKRQGAPGDFRSNLHRGGTAIEIKLTKKEDEAAVKAAKTMGLRCAGVDILRSNKGPLILEVNSSPGLEGIEKATGIDIANKIIKHIEKEIKKVRSGKKEPYHG
ncbi:MAG: 30S ribosomal protein S6--L-glutamate ligase [Gammaproteobacteria bacterium]|nr:30S ribosomal protein S6--L-glutamate ligase [Gammaproteobacteria bacterium]